MTTCKHCGRRIVQDDEDGWIDPEATGDDSIWRETCDSHDTFSAEHEPETCGRCGAELVPAPDGTARCPIHGHPLLAR